jgi:hypothetical protein
MTSLDLLLEKFQLSMRDESTEEIYVQDWQRP